MGYFEGTPTYMMMMMMVVIVTWIMMMMMVDLGIRASYL